MVRLAASLLFLLVIQKSYSTEITDPTMNYTISLPENWVQEEVSSQHHRFYDTTSTYRSQINIVRHTFSKVDYPHSEDWTLVNYIANEIAIKNSHNPLGIFLYGDSSSSLIQPDSLRAAEIYARFCYLDTVSIYWEEFVRFAASDTFGYEMYVLGDTADMKANVAFYAAIIQNITLPAEQGQNRIIYSLTEQQSQFHREKASALLFDLRGRRINGMNNRNMTSGIYLRKQTDIPNSKNVLIKGGSR